MIPPTPAAPLWLEIAISAPLSMHEALNSFLFDLGCQGTLSTESLDDRDTSPQIAEYLQQKIRPDPVLKKKDNDGTKANCGEVNFSQIKGYLAAPFDVASVQSRLELFIQELRTIFQEARAVHWTFRELATENWSDNWRKFFKPDKITFKLMIVPVWESIPKNSTEVVIKMDPGPAFGTGQHATTRMCLQAMEAIPLKASWSMLDIGTGSGILAIYGAKAGAARIVALDNDPEALGWAKKNMELNRVMDRITLSGRPLAEWHESFTLVVANLILGTILELAPFFCCRLEPDGRLILSGLLADQLPEVEAILKTHGLTLEKILHQDEWICLVFREYHAPLFC